MTTKTINLYLFDKLTDKAKDKAREWFYECESMDFGGSGELNEPAETAAKLLGIELGAHAVRLMGGGTRHEPNIYWSLDGQGQGTCFDGSYSYAKGSVKAIAAEFPTNTELNRIARELAKLQKQYRYALRCKVVTNSRDVHKYSMDVELDNYGEGVKEDDCKALLELMRDFADWIFAGIKAEYEYRTSDEAVEESIKANDYTFDASGKREDAN